VGGDGEYRKVGGRVSRRERGSELELEEIKRVEKLNCEREEE